MTTISVRIDDGKPVLIVDGEPVAANATVTLPAQSVAQLAEAFRVYGRNQAVAPRPPIGFRPPVQEIP